MATVTDQGYPNLVNVARRLTPTGSVEQMLANTLTKEMPVLEDIPWKEGNLPTGHRVTAVNALPSPTWRRMNQGLAPIKGETLQYDESCGMLEGYSKIDCALAELNGQQAAYRAAEDKIFLEGFGQQAAASIFYASTVGTPEQIQGLTPRYAASTGYTASSYVVKSGTLASSSCYSIWIITWDEDRVFGIYPKASKAGLEYEDMGKQLVLDNSSLQFKAYVTHFVWKMGMCVKDYRYAVRMQWDSTDTTNNSITSKTLFLNLEQALGTIWKVTDRTRIYMNRATRAMLGAQLAANNTFYLQYMKDGGGLQESFLGVPIRISDSLVAENAIS